MITKMTKYTFLLLSSDTEAFLREIQELGVLDITRSRKPVDATSAQLFREAEALRHEIETVEKCDFSRDERHSAIQGKLDAAEAAYAEKKHWGDLDRAKVKALREQAVNSISIPFPSRNSIPPGWMNIPLPRLSATRNSSASSSSTGPRKAPTISRRPRRPWP